MVVIGLLAGMFAAALAWLTASVPRAPNVHLLGIAVAKSLTEGEGAHIFGGLQLPQGSYEVDVWTCTRQACVRTSWDRLSGPGTVWGWLGFEKAPPARHGRVIVRIYEVGSPRPRLVGKWSGRVSLE